MKKWILLLIISGSFTVRAQNIGISTTSPTSKFQIHSTATFGRPTIRLVDSTAGSGPILEFRNGGGDNYFQMGAALNNADPTQSFFSIYSNLSGTPPFTIKGNNNVGIGILDPQQRFHVHNDAITGVSNAYGVFTNLSTGVTATDGVAVGVNSFGSGYLMNQEANRGLFLGTQGLDRVSILANGNVGIGAGGALERLQVNGNLNLTGLLKLNGVMGTAGQVLTSNGSSIPEWRNAAYGNNTRFSATFAATGGGFNVNLTSVYNVNPTDITIGAVDIAISKSGLYHFEGVFITRANFSAVPSTAPTIDLFFVVNSTSYNMILGKQLPTSHGTADRYASSEKFSIDLHLVASTNIRLQYILYTSAIPTSSGCSGWFNGHLISE
jgi:hypothetical protein